MPIPTQEIIDRVRQVGLDAEGADYYDDDIDIIPAINASLEWLTAIISSAFGQKKMGEEVFQDLVLARVFQTNDFSRVFFDSADLGHEPWTILGIYINPIVREGGLLFGKFSDAIPSPTAPKAIVTFESFIDLSIVSAGDSIDFTYIDKTTGLEVTNTFIIISVNNITKAMLLDTVLVTDLGAQLDAGDIMTAKQVFLNPSTTSTPLILSTTTVEESLYRPDLAHIESDNSATRLTIEEWAKNKKNPFAAGNTVLPDGCDTIRYAYLNYANYSAPETPYSVPKEIEIRPSVANDIVTVFYAKKPNKITQASDTIEFPVFFADWIRNKTLNALSIKQGDGTTVHSVTSAEINTLLQSIT